MCRLFRRYEDCTPGEYLIALKLNRAVNLLLNSQLAVKEIAGLLNFDTPYSFSRTFKKNLGKSPAKYREDTLQDGKPEILSALTGRDEIFNGGNA
jgi:transcriptional regulator GlxA family with amidase domain